MANSLSVTRTYDRIFSIVRDEVSGPALFDNVTTRTSYLFAQKMKGNIVRVNGRAHFRFNILKELPTTVGYTDLDTLTPQRGDPVTSAVYEYCLN